MKTAILICNDFTVLGGEERFTIELAKATDADIIVPSFDKKITRIYDPTIETKFISLNVKLPKEPLKQIYGMWLYNHVNLKAYDFLIALDDMAVHALNNHNKHLYYILTPRKAFYDMYYYTISKYSFIKKIIFAIGLNLFSAYDRYYVKKNVKNFAAISHIVRSRICRIYQRPATVIYPPVHTETYTYKQSQGYWLHVGRIDKWKRVNLQIEAFRQMSNKELKLVGKVFPKYDKMSINAPSNVSFYNNIPEKDLIEMYSNCEGYIATSMDEDFGISLIEAMASGKPVVATKEGGHLETIIDGHTGILVSPVVNEIIEAVKKVSYDPYKYKTESENQAQKFSYETFKTNINVLIKHLGPTK